MATNDQFFNETNGIFEDKIKDQDDIFIDNQKWDLIDDQTDSLQRSETVFIEDHK